MPCVIALRLALSLDGAESLTAEPLADLVQEAERGKLDFVTVDGSPDVIAAQVAPLTTRIGLIPAVTMVEVVREPGTGLSTEPVVAALADSPDGYRFAGRSADLVFVTPSDPDEARAIVAAVRSEQAAAGRDERAVRIFADLCVFIDDSELTARERLSHHESSGDEFASSTAVFAGTPSQLVARLQAWQRAGIEGFRLRPGELPHDLRAITRSLVPLLQDNDAFRRGYEAKTLRALLGLPRVLTPSPQPAG